MITQNNIAQTQTKYNYVLQIAFELTDTQVQELAELKGWRMIPDDEYAFDGYAIQRKKSFLGIEYWKNEYLCKDKESAIKSLKKRAL